MLGKHVKSRGVVLGGGVFGVVFFKWHYEGKKTMRGGSRTATTRKVRSKDMPFTTCKISFTRRAPGMWEGINEIQRTTRETLINTQEGKKRKLIEQGTNGGIRRH